MKASAKIMTQWNRSARKLKEEISRWPSWLKAYRWRSKTEMLPQLSWKLQPNNHRNVEMSMKMKASISLNNGWLHAEISIYRNEMKISAERRRKWNEIIEEEMSSEEQRREGREKKKLWSISILEAVNEERSIHCWLSPSVEKYQRKLREEKSSEREEEMQKKRGWEKAFLIWNHNRREAYVKCEEKLRSSRRERKWREGLLSNEETLWKWREGIEEERNSNQSAFS